MVNSSSPSIMIPILTLLAFPLTTLQHPSGILRRDMSNNAATREIASVIVIDTPVVRAAESYLKAHSDEWLYKHVMRSWLYGTLLYQSNETLSASIDREVHAVATLLHDLGWDRANGSGAISTDKRFEVDGAIAARDFLSKFTGSGAKWDERRTQLVWDSIALHTEPSISWFKEPVVQTVSKGIAMDFFGPDGSGVDKSAYDAVTAAFPKDELSGGGNETLVWLCATKPATTYDTWMQPWGEHYVANYSTKGKLKFDTLFADL